MVDAFIVQLSWTGAEKGPTRDPATFSRDLSVCVGPTVLPMSAAPGYRGDPYGVNPEQLFVMALSSCQAWTYLVLAAKSGVSVVAYTDDAEGWLGVADGQIRMSRVTLRPRITLESGTDEFRARELVAKAHENCFVGNSVTTPIEVVPEFVRAAVPAAETLELAQDNPRRDGS